MAERHQLARPIMRRPGGLKPHQARRQRSKELQQLVAADRLGDYDTPRSINAVILKDVLGQIEPNSPDRRQISNRLFYGRRSLQTVALTTTILAPLVIEPGLARASSTPSFYIEREVGFTAQSGLPIFGSNL